jgi:hypothetical protein
LSRGKVYWISTTASVVALDTICRHVGELGVSDNIVVYRPRSTRTGDSNISLIPVRYTTTACRVDGKGVGYVVVRQSDVSTSYEQGSYAIVYGLAKVRDISRGVGVGKGYSADVAQAVPRSSTVTYLELTSIRLEADLASLEYGVSTSPRRRCAAS